MNILDEGIDCKGKKYKRRDLGQVKDITNQQFTYLIPLFRVEGKRNQWLCKCKCNNIVVVQANHLIEGMTKSCGCYKSEQSRNKSIIHREGQTFNELTVIEKVYKPNNHHRFWKCKCSCGNYTIVQDENLIYGVTKSCGHLNHQIEDLTGQNFGFWHVLEISKNNIPRTKWVCQCKCGVIREVAGATLKNGTSTSCGCKRSSSGADKIESILKNEKLQYQKEFCFPDLKSPKLGILRFDFAIFEKEKLQCLIEFDGELHYQSRKDFGGNEGLVYRRLCDNLKNQYCIDNSISLYRIPYFDKKISSFKEICSKKYLVS